jgi:pyridoxamine 5'-phosphate oxidase family protein
MMSGFSDAEISYLKSQRLGRLATVDSNGQPHVVPVGFRYNPKEDAIEIGGHSGFAKRKKYRDVLQNPRVAFVVDDVPSVNPWTVRGIEIRGQSQVLEHGGTELGSGFDLQMFRIRPNRIISWGINSKDFYQQSARSVA